MLEIFKKEFNSFFNSLIGYMVIGIFLIVMGLIFWVYPETSVLDFGYANMDTLFNFCPFVFIFIIPAITMRLFAEEKKTGTLELLFTKPLKHYQIILGKFLSAVSVIIIALLPTLIYYYSISQLGSPIGNIDSARVIGSYLGLVLLASTFASIGVFTSALTDNQIIAFILSVFINYVLYAGFDSLAGISSLSDQAYWIQQLGMSAHYDFMSRGLIDTREIMYFFSVVSLFLLFTNLIFTSKKW
ncbi:gliding motility-associated ABC transporter permease subunit GldF [Aureibacter tunicatorum]|uniref:ABC-2 type transport system permease protein n=1 Tax=Aureibacter tunicatorum TaxID=866807 RepID=A0AAE3XR57_9BACT|nr:gliding motility-associated ABC transporter permease subunit GldF [Aureibacter tunicatorum]MDR6241248.1 ABC-2 type transport system permease protein [Aureibacter tunicatorum]BDD03508.1 gliding motility-associated ABC transporter permease subunit GldF [Aureibacter tunicatorum]